MKLNQSNPKPIKSPRAISCVATLSDFLNYGAASEQMQSKKFDLVFFVKNVW